MANETNTQRGGLHKYAIQVAAGKTTKRTIRGTTIRVADSPYEVIITAHNKKLNGGRGTSFSLPMKKFEKWFTDIEYDEIEIENPGESNITVELQLGYGDFVAEILSRTVAASGFNSVYFSHGTESPSAGLNEVPFLDDNPQRKRVQFGVMEWTSGAGAIDPRVGPAGLVLDQAGVEALAYMNTLEVLDAGFECTAAMSIYYWDPGDLADVEIFVNYIEEVHTAS